MKQKHLIHNTDWDFLVILDACRYDFFNELYPCKKVISSATWTLAWLQSTWPDFYADTTYISGNVYCSAKHKLTKHHRYGGLYMYEGKKHFPRIVDVWDRDWSKEHGTVLPISINRAFHKAYLINPNGRFILHYMQPHRPYVTIGGQKRKRDMTERHKTHISGDINRHKLKGYIPERWKWRLSNFMGKSVPPYAEIYLKEGKEGLKNVYQNEIKNVMKYVEMLTESISGKWVITADHGEWFCHPFMCSHGGAPLKDVTEVPWLEVGGVK